MMSRSVKRIVISVCAVVLAVALIFGIMLLIKNLRKQPVNVYPVSSVGMTDFYGDYSESYGAVTADRIQKIYLSQTQTLIKVLVKAGDTVKEGDPVLTYSTALGELDIIKAEINLEKCKLELESTRSFLESLDRVPVSEGIKKQIDILEAELEKEEERIAKYKPIYPDLPCGSGTEDDPLYVEYGDDMSIMDFIPSEPDDEMFVVFVMSEDGNYIGYSGIKFASTNGEATFSFFEAAPLEGEYPEFEDNREEIQNKINEYYEMYSKSYGYAELAALKISKVKEVKDLEIKVKTAEIELERKREEIGDGTVYSNFDGIVKTVREGSDQYEAVVEISDGGGYYVKCGIGEFDVDNINIGDEVEVYSWMSGISCTGVIYNVDKTKTYTGDYYSGGNPNISSYEMTVFVDDSFDLSEGDSVSVSYKLGVGEDAFFLPSMFIRYDNGKPYVMIRGEGEKLQKKFISIGVELYGEYCEIRDGVGLDDYIAFPYGTDVKEGANTTVAGLEELYGGDFNFYGAGGFYE